MSEQPKLREPWVRQYFESHKAFAAFRAYLEMGPDRSLAAVGEQLGKSTALMERWSARWGWVDRCRQHDDATRAEAEHRAFEAQVEEKLAEQQENEKQRKARLQEARLLAQTAQGGIVTAAPVALARLRAAQAEVTALIAGNASPEKVTAAIADAVAVLNWATKSLDVAHKLEAQALGKPTDRIAIQFDAASIDRLTDIITKRVPQDQWEDVGDEIAVVLKGQRVGEHSE